MPTLITVDYHDDHDGLCGMLQRGPLPCGECGDEFHIDERSEEYPKLCAECGSEKHHDEVRVDLEPDQETVGGWDGEDDELPRLKKLLAYAKRLKERRR